MTAPLVVFDLDGTLIDGYEGITDALAYAMEKMGLAALPVERVRAMVGHGLEKLIEQAAGGERAVEGVGLFRARYPAVVLEKTRLLPDVPEVLETLASRGYRMAVASNKPAAFSRLILEARGVQSRFFAIAGPDDQTPVKPDPAMLHRLMREAGASPAGTVAVGDMEVDSEFARAAGCRVVLVAGGSRTREELEGVPCDALLDRLGALPAWLEASGLKSSRPTTIGPMKETPS